jgi:hypothetical protein
LFLNGSRKYNFYEEQEKFLPSLVNLINFETEIAKELVKWSSFRMDELPSATKSPELFGARVGSRVLSEAKV